jgi:hypothetical protein
MYMDILIRILIGLALVAGGFYFVWKTENVLGFFGSVDWAEQHLGGGGSRLFYKLLGIVIILIGFIVATNMWNAFMEATLGSLFPQPPVSNQ